MPFVEVDFMHVLLYRGESEWFGGVCAVVERDCWITVVARCCIVPVCGVSGDKH